MTSILSVGSAAGVLQSLATETPGSVLGHLQSGSTSINPPATQDAIAKLFASDPDLQSVFADEYAAVMADPVNDGFSSQDGQHLSLFETISKNRDVFPADGFTLRTELSDGGSIETEIAPSASAAKQSQIDAVSALGSDSGQAMSRIVSAVLLREAEGERQYATLNQLADRYA